MKSAKKGKQNRNFLPLLLLIVLLIAAGVELINVSGKLRAGRAEEARLTAQKQQSQQENDALRADLDKADDPEFLQELAREQLGMAEAGERIFYDVND
ncbi:MAG: cell division protein FtsL [Oscillospiraceae bacterium]|nr:cell division protein FtsL [Oscillospiraceae bacterium]